jgi:surfactin synthase thioesterase subunit
VEYGAIASEIAANPVARRLVEPALLADLQLISSYRHQERAPLSVPITVVWGVNDISLPLEMARGWSAYTAVEFRVRAVNAGHWFMEENPRESAAVLAEEARGTLSNQVVSTSDLRLEKN